MLQKVMSWLRSLLNPRTPLSSEEHEKFFEVRVKALEAKAEWMEREAKLRERAAAASARIKAVTPQGRWLRWVVLGAGLFVLFLIIKSCV